MKKIPVRPTPEEDAGITAAALTDEDNPPLTNEELGQFKPTRGRPVGSVAESRKEPISIRLSPEVVESFRATGEGWQTRIDEVLKAWVQEHPL
jgi:uncharacterized protein (DUF4415 family)